MPDTIERPTSADLRDRLFALGDEIRQLRALPEERRPDSHTATLTGLVNDLRQTDAEFEATRRLEADAFQRAMWDHAIAEQAAADADPNRRNSRGPSAGHSEGFGDTRSAGEIFTESEQWLQRSSYNVELGEVRNLLTSSSAGTSGSSAFVPVGSPAWNSNARRQMRFFLRDLIPVSNTNLTSIPYIRELNAATNETGAGMVTEASAKPEVTAQFETVDAPVRKIAAWLQMTEEAYNDAPTLRGYIDTRLAYMLQVKEEQQYLSGTGTAPEIKGILNTTGVQTQAAISNDLAGTIGMAFSKIENVDGFADGIAINPVTFWTGVVTRHSTWMDGSQFGSSGGAIPFSDPGMELWGVPVVRTRGLTTNKALVGCYSIGAQIFERMGTTIKSTDSHASLFISNTLVILAEKREALAVHRPDYFVDTTLAFS